MRRTVFTPTLLLTLASLIFATTGTAAPQITGETETGTDGLGESFFGQFIWLDTAHFNVVGRYFWVNDILERGELAIGPPVFHINKNTTLKIAAGATTDKEVMVYGLFATKVFGHDLIYDFEPKWATKADGVDNHYHKLWVGLNQSGNLLFRIEHLHVAGKISFLRIGGEYQFRLNTRSPPTHFYISPWYDPQRNQPGAQIGFRF